MGLKESECGQIGVIMMAGTLGWIMEAPAATAYAVLPVGVDTITPEGAQRHMHGVNQSTISQLRYKYCTSTGDNLTSIRHNKSIVSTNVQQKLKYGTKNDL